MELDSHKFIGMSRDTHPINQKPEFLWEAHNIRITNREDSTLMSLTNEKGNTNSGILFVGKYLGHCVIDNYLVVFTYLDSVGTHIYRVHKDSNNNFICILLYSGGGITDGSTSIQSLGIKEGELLVKVYWTDGLSLPKMIIITKPELDEVNIVPENDYSPLWNNGANDFRFIPELKLKETIEVKREGGDGAFSSGTIQYAFSYYNKYSAESNIFYTTPLYNISNYDRGGKPDDVIGNSFVINIDNLDYFDYLRIYSIHRTSIDTTPVVKIVSDIKIEGTSLKYVDNGNSQQIVDPSILLYIGGSSILAGCIKNIENTMFFGNITDNVKYIKDVYYEHPAVEGGSPTYESVKNYIGKAENITEGYRTISIANNYDTDVYKYANLLSDNTSTFKYQEWYRLGVQFLYKDGSWSEPVYIGDYTIKNHSSVTLADGTHLLNLPILNSLVYKQASEALIKNGYKKARGVVVFPAFQTKKVLASGVLCPTVFTIGDRLRNSPFALSSWFFRPLFLSIGSNDKNVENGAFIASNHLSNLGHCSTRAGEIFGSNGPSFDEATSDILNLTELKYNSNSTEFYIDQSILTFHSPDVEFGDISDIEGYKYKLSITDLVAISHNSGDIEILTSSPPIYTLSTGDDDENAAYDSGVGFIHIPMESSPIYGNAGRRLCSGLFYDDAIVEKNEKDGNYEYLPFSRFKFMVNPWHKSGSLNNDLVRTADSGTLTAVLLKKIISNLLYAEKNIDVRDSNISYDVNNIEIFNSDTVSMVKVPGLKLSKLEQYNYFGNVDTLLNSMGYVYVTKSNNLPFDTVGSNIVRVDKYSPSGGGEYKKNIAKLNNPSVRMKYKSSPHIVLNLSNGIENNRTYILPSVNGHNIYSGKSIPFWLNQISSPTNLPYSKEIKGIVFNYEADAYELDELYKGLQHIKVINIGDLVIQKVGLDFYALYEAVNTVNDSTTWTQILLTLENSTIYGYYNRGMSEDNVYIYLVLYIGYEHLGSEYYLKQTRTETVSTEDLYGVLQSNINVNYSGPYLFLADLIRDEDDISNPFGGNSDKALLENIWIPAGEPLDLDPENAIQVQFKYGDTWYQRYDCLKTYPFTNEDENLIVEIASFMCESRINIDGRYDRNRGQKSNLLMSPLNFNLLNKAYSLKDSYFKYYILDESFYKTNKFPTLINWSMEKSPGELIDTWMHIVPSSRMVLDGSYGDITSILIINDNLLAFLENAVNIINYKNRVLIPTSDGVPIEILNSYKVDGFKVLYSHLGCQDINAIISTKSGIYFLDNLRKAFYLFDGLKINNLSESLGMQLWIKDNTSNSKWEPQMMENNNIKLFYDNCNSDIYLSPGPQFYEKDALCYSEKLLNFTSIMSYGGILGFEEFLGSVISLKSDSDNIILWKLFEGDYNYFYNEYKPFSLSFISNNDYSYSKIFDTIEYRADMWDKYDNHLPLETFKYIQVDNEYQDTTIRRDIDGTNKWNPIKKFRVWRGLLPRDLKNLLEGKRAKTRICNPWTRITLGYDEENSNKMVLHDVTVKYTV